MRKIFELIRNEILLLGMRVMLFGGSLGMVMWGRVEITCRWTSPLHLRRQFVPNGRIGSARHRPEPK
jgi:hypothetical protein